MLNKLVKKIFGSRNDRLVKRTFKVVDQVNALEEEVRALSDDALRARTTAFRERLTQAADRKMAEGLPRSRAYAFASNRMAWPIIAATATTLAAFMPLLFWPGVVMIIGAALLLRQIRA